MLFLLGFYDRFLGIARESLTLMSPKKIYNWDLIDLKAWIIWKNPLLAFKFLTKKAVMYPSSQKAITPPKKKKKKRREKESSNFPNSIFALDSFVIFG